MIDIAFSLEWLFVRAATIILIGVIIGAVLTREKVTSISNNGLLAYRMHTYYNIYKVVILKDTKDVILELRMKKACHKINLPKRSIYKASGIPLGNKETIPNTETLKLLSKFFDVSINTLLGSPRQLICRCCGMPLDDSSISKEPDGKFNEEYCKRCYTDGKFTCDYDNTKTRGGRRGSCKLPACP